MTPAQMEAELQAIARHPRGVVGRMKDLEFAKGFLPIEHGAREPIAFPTSEWHDGVLSRDDRKKEVRIVAVFAKDSGKGALTRLISSIRAAGYCPVIVEPIGLEMPAILLHWRWHKTMAEYDNEVVEEWRPSGGINL